MTHDVIAHLAFADRTSVSGETPQDLRRPIARAEAQNSYYALFQPRDDSDFPISERWVVAAFATALTAPDHTAHYYADAATQHHPSAAAALIPVLEKAATPGPYGVYPEAGLAAENEGGLRLTLTDSEFSPRLRAALAHTHLLVKRPREASSLDQQRLLDAGWHPNGIVTLSQLIAFLSFQQRVVIGLRALNAESSS